MNRTVLLSPPDVGDLESKYVAEALASGWVAPAGPDLAAFEAEMATRLDVEHAVAVSSGTAALHLALLGMGVGAGDVVLTSTMTFAATANAICYTGAQPYFVDSEPASGNLDVELLAEAAERLRADGRHLAAIVPVDLLGRCSDMAGVARVAADHDAAVLVDAAESLGASWQGRPAGSFGRASILSFNGNKVMTTSGGGMVVTGERALADRVRYLSTQARQPVAHYEHTEVGYNYRLSNILAALGRAQLSRLDDMIARRRWVRAGYRSLFADAAGVAVFGGEDDAADNCWLTAVVVDPAVAGFTSAQLSAAMGEAGIETRPLWKPMHLQPAFATAPAIVTGVAQHLFENGLTLPSGSSLSDEDVHYVHDHVRSFLDGRGG